MTTKKSMLTILSLLIPLSMVLSACATPTAAPTSAPAQQATQPPAPAAAKGHHIALVQFLKGHPVHRLMQLGFSDACTDLKYDCELLLTDSTTAEDMIPLAEQALAEPVEAIGYYP